MPAILEGSQYHKHSYRGGGWRVVGSHKVVGTSDTKLLYGHMASIQAVFSSTYIKM